MSMNPHGGRVLEWLKEGKEGIDLSASLNPLGPPEVLRKRWLDLFPALSLYPPLDPRFVGRLLEAIYGFPQEALLPCNGATQGIYLLGRVLSGKTVVIVEPCFTEYARAFRLGGKEIRHLPVFPESPLNPLEALRRADIVVLGNPGNPLGDTEGLSLYFRAREEGLSTVFVVDEAFQEFLGEETSLVFRVFFDRNLYIVRSLTKYFALAGLRGGFVVTHPENVTLLCDHLEPWSVNTVLVRALELLASEDLSPFREATRCWLLGEKAFLEREFSALPFLSFFPSRANFYTLWMEEEDPEFFAFLETRGIFVRRLGDFFGLDGRFFRVAVRTRKENERFLEVVKEYGRTH
uniref:Aminotransferase class I/II-fold pyridoxal phosphate-dependent enzyme n=1 Tax=Candidatus Caldatribacterium californiense TaxID=1454726 RepID=A0A7V3YMG2_9BACT